MCKNKIVLLRKRKRHTTRRVESTPCVVLSRGVPVPGGGYPVLGYPPVLTWLGGTPSQDGVPSARCEDTGNITFPILPMRVVMIKF